MIGVIARSDETAIAAEFFELFKTPWEFYQQGKAYEVVLATVTEVTEVHAPLLLVFGSQATGFDTRLGIMTEPAPRGVALVHGDVKMPVYGDLLQLRPPTGSTSCLSSTSGCAGVAVDNLGRKVLRLGFDFFQEIRSLLQTGQPPEEAAVPTLELHIELLRRWIVESGVDLVEIPPVPAGHDFFVSLTHDIDFVGIRDHKLDHTLAGYVLRSTVGAVREWVRGRMSWVKLLRVWRAVASLPMVWMGLARDFWVPFPWYLTVEEGLHGTYYLIPFKGRRGERVQGGSADRRATKYDVGDLGEWIPRLRAAGCELGVHGIDAWHSVELGRRELERVAAATGVGEVGVRMHWLLSDANTFSVLDQAGYAYDSTVGYNETIGYRAGTVQVYRPPGVQRLLELPMHIQDGALFFPNRLDLPEAEAWTRCEKLMEMSRRFGGVLTLLWHDRSHGPERFWGEFYSRLVDRLKESGVCFVSAGQVVTWFRARRQVAFRRASPDRAGAGAGLGVELSYSGAPITPPLRVRVHHGRDGSGPTVPACTETTWDGTGPVRLPNSIPRGMSGMPGAADRSA